MAGEQLYRLTWDDAFAQFVESIEEYVALDLPDDASPAERKLQDDMRHYLNEYKAAIKAQEVKDNASPSKKTD